MKLEAGDVLLMYPNIKWHDWFPRTVWAVKMWFVYRVIQRHQKLDYTYNEAVHCGVVTDELRFFEVTYPNAQFTPISDLNGRRVTVCRPVNGVPNPEGLLAKCSDLWSLDYDIWELVDFLASALVWKNSTERRAIFDSQKETVCSSGAALVEQAGGVDLDKDPMNIRPAYYENRPRLFNVTKFDKFQH